MSESDLLASDHIDGLDGLENGQDGDAIMQCDGVKRELSEANIDDPVSNRYHYTRRQQYIIIIKFSLCKNDLTYEILFIT